MDSKISYNICIYRFSLSLETGLAKTGLAPKRAGVAPSFIMVQIVMYPLVLQLPGDSVLTGTGDHTVDYGVHRDHVQVHLLVLPEAVQDSHSHGDDQPHRTVHVVYPPPDGLLIRTDYWNNPRCQIFNRSGCQNLRLNTKIAREIQNTVITIIFSFIFLHLQSSYIVPFLLNSISS